MRCIALGEQSKLARGGRGLVWGRGQAVRRRPPPPRPAGGGGGTAPAGQGPPAAATAPAARAAPVRRGPPAGVAAAASPRQAGPGHPGPATPSRHVGQHQDPDTRAWQLFGKGACPLPTSWRGHRRCSPPPRGGCHVTSQPGRPQVNPGPPECR